MTAKVTNRVRPSVATMQEERERRIGAVMESDIYKNREEFTTTQSAALLGITQDSAKQVLNHMEREGLLLKRIRAAVAYYQAPMPNLLKTDWRKDPAVYDLIAEENHQRLVAECEGAW